MPKTRLANALQGFPKSLLQLILALIFAGITAVSFPAIAAEGERPSETPGSALDDWDDDMWSDWGSPATTKGGATQPEQKENADSAARDTSWAPSNSIEGSGFGVNTDVIRFRLVREGISEGPRGVRKYRPTYGKKRL